MIFSRPRARPSHSVLLHLTNSRMTRSSLQKGSHSGASPASPPFYQRRQLMLAAQANSMRSSPECKPLLTSTQPSSFPPILSTVLQTPHKYSQTPDIIRRYVRRTRAQQPGLVRFVTRILWCMLVSATPRSVARVDVHGTYYMLRIATGTASATSSRSSSVSYNAAWAL